MLDLSSSIVRAWAELASPEWQQGAVYDHAARQPAQQQPDKRTSTNRALVPRRLSKASPESGAPGVYSARHATQWMVRLRSVDGHYWTKCYPRAQLAAAVAFAQRCIAAGEWLDEAAD